MVDEWGNLFVYKIEEKDSALKTILLLDITSSDYVARTSSESDELRLISINLLLGIIYIDFGAKENLTKRIE